MLHGITLTELAEKTGLHKSTITRKLGDTYTLPSPPVGVGRSEKLYSLEALELWSHVLPAQYEHARKPRTDRARSRKITPELETEFFERLFKIVMGAAQFNLRLAVEKLCAQFEIEGKGSLDVEYMYEKRVIRRDMYYVSPVHVNNWKDKHYRAYHRDVLNKELNGTRYNYLELGESIGWLGKGFGAAEVGWAIDCRSYDARTIDADGKVTLGRAIFIRCALTGMALWLKPIAGKNETAQEVIDAVLECAIYWQKTPQVFFALDNGSGLNAERTLGVLRSLLPDSAYTAAAQLPGIFHNHGPLLFNMAHTPTSPIKAALERSFKIVKDEYDAVYFAKSYAGGTRQEAVRLSISNVPVMHHAELATTAFYNNQLWHWLGNEYANRLRPAMFFGFQKRTGLAPTVANVSQYYWSNEKRLPAPEKCATLLYWTARAKGRRKCKMGRVECLINGGNWVCAHAGLAKYFGQHITVVPMPSGLFDAASASGYVGQVALLFYTGAIPGSLEGTEENPVFIGLAQNSYITSYEQLEAVKPAVMQAMKGTLEYFHTPIKQLKTAQLPDVPDMPKIQATANVVEVVEVIEIEEVVSVEEVFDDALEFDPYID